MVVLAAGSRTKEKEEQGEASVRGDADSMTYLVCSSSRRRVTAIWSEQWRNLDEQRPAIQVVA